MKKQSILYGLLFIYINATAQNKTYYISNSGNDASDGLSTATAWQTLSPVNSLALQPGDKILLEGGQSFTGTIQLDANDKGTAANPVTISSYGSGRATIYAVDNAAIYANNSGGFYISDLIFKGKIGRASCRERV